MIIQKLAWELAQPTVARLDLFVNKTLYVTAIQFDPGETGFSLAVKIRNILKQKDFMSPSEFITDIFYVENHRIDVRIGRDYDAKRERSRLVVPTLTQLSKNEFDKYNRGREDRITKRAKEPLVKPSPVAIVPPPPKKRSMKHAVKPIKEESV